MRTVEIIVHGDKAPNGRTVDVLNEAAEVIAANWPEPAGVSVPIVFIRDHLPEQSTDA